jgi:carbamoyl-phosphate synthase small subunit
MSKTRAPAKTARSRAAKSAGRKTFSDWDVPRTTGLLVLADGLVIEGQGFGAEGEAVGEVCFNTAMTGYQEILTDPSYAGQIITFTFPHIGNVGTNEDDIETVNLAASGVRLHCQGAGDEPANYRSHRHRSVVTPAHCRPGVDTRALTNHPRQGMPNGVIA